MSNHFPGEARLTCGICGQMYDEPRILPCLHTFCMKCIEGLDAFIPSLLSVRPLISTNKSATSSSMSPAVISTAVIKGSLTLDSTGESGASGYETEKSPTVSTGSLARPLGSRTTNGSHSSSGRSTLHSSNRYRPFDGKNRTILCPACDSEVDLPAEGAAHLPLHYILQNKVLTATLNAQVGDDKQRSNCELCVGKIHAVSWCINCQVRICAFCSEAHKRQRLTDGHRVLALEEAMRHELLTVAPPRSGDKLWPVCFCHPTEELRLFCELCKTTICRDCCMPGGEHRGHRSKFVAEVAEEKIGDLKNLLAQVLPKAEALRTSLAAVRCTAKKVQARQAQACQEVDAFADDYIVAVETHRRNLLDRVRKMCEMKQRILKLQSIQLEQALEDVDTLRMFVEQLVREGSDVEILTLLGHVARRLKELGVERHQLEPRVDEYLKLARDEVAGHVNGFPLRGALTAQKLCPVKCILKGNGVPVARQGQKIGVTIITKDTEGLLMRKGGHNPKVELVSKDDANKSVPVKTVDRKDGTYSISFAPEQTQTGLYWLSVTFQENHIQGSPFPIPIKNKWLAHSGLFHCCTFCSSGGNKEKACGCSGTMPGGFKGCGHGHRGHPGKKHWSCCGKTTENSECSRSLPKTYEFTI